MKVVSINVRWLDIKKQSIIASKVKKVKMIALQKTHCGEKRAKKIEKKAKDWTQIWRLSKETKRVTQCLRKRSLKEQRKQKAVKNKQQQEQKSQKNRW